MRVKSRFHQIFEWVNWSENIQEVWTKLSPEQQQELAFIQAHQPLLKALNTIQKLVKALNNILKIKGLSQATIEQSLALLKADLPDLPKVYLFKGLIPGEPMGERSIQYIITEALQKTNIKKQVSIHTLRHSYATHLPQDGIDIHSILHLFGYKF